MKRKTRTGVTYETIGRATGFSKMTVSLAFRNHPSIPESTRQKITVAAQKLGYRPNPMVAAFMSSLRQNRRWKTSANLGYLDAHRSIEEVRRSRSLSELLDGAEQRAIQQGYNFVPLMVSDPKLTPQRVASILKAQGIQGVLLAPLPQLDWILPLDYASVTHVALGHSFRNLRMHRANSNQFHAIELVLMKLQARGCQRIGLAVDAAMDLRLGKIWSAVFARHYLSMPSRRRVKPLLFQPECRDVKPAFLDWLRREKPDGLIGESQPLHHWLREAGIKVPEQIAYASLSCVRGSNECSGIRKELSAVGAAGVDLVIGQLYRNERGLPEHPQTVSIQGEWVDGKTA